jgi:hypothetical protein
VWLLTFFNKKYKSGYKKYFYVSTDFLFEEIFTFFLDEPFGFAQGKSNKKIKPDPDSYRDCKLENYHEVAFRSPSRSSFVLNSRTAATSLPRCFVMLFI